MPGVKRDVFQKNKRGRGIHASAFPRIESPGSPTISIEPAQPALFCQPTPKLDARCASHTAGLVVGIRWPTAGDAYPEGAVIRIHKANAGIPFINAPKDK